MHRIRITSVLLTVLMSAACAERHGTHLIGQLIYEGADAEVASAVPANADPSVADCVPNSSSLDSSGRGIKVAADITPPYFVALWPVAKENRPENHGRIDRPSVGKPTPGDHPFIKFIVCKLDSSDADLTKSYDWSMDEQLDGEYYVGAWFDRDMNGFPGLDEPLGYYREDATGPAAVVTFKDGKVQRFDIVIASKAAGFEKQRDELIVNLQTALQDKNEALFAAQFHPLYFKDPFGRTINEIGELYGELVTDTNGPETTVAWFGDQPPALTKGGGASGILTIIQERPAKGTFWLDRGLTRQVNVVIGASADGVFQFVDWQPVSEQSGDLTYSEKASLTFGGDAELKWKVNFPVIQGIWLAPERFAPATDATSGGAWTADFLNNGGSFPAPFTFMVPATGDFNIGLSPTVLSTAVGFNDVDLAKAAQTVLRMTILPVSGENSYPLWPGGPTASTEPNRGQYLRFYHYGNDYVYRKPPPAQ
jgi:hypothetical protein